MIKKNVNLFFTSFLLFFAEDEFGREDENWSKERMKNQLEFFKKNIWSARKDEHNGDCTNMPYTCMRCVIDQYKKDAKNFLEVYKKNE